MPNERLDDKEQMGAGKLSSITKEYISWDVQSRTEHAAFK